MMILGVFFASPVFSQKYSLSNIEHSIQKKEYTKAEHLLNEYPSSFVNSELKKTHIELLKLKLATAKYFDTLTIDKSFTQALKSIRKIDTLQKKSKIIEFSSIYNDLKNRWISRLVNSAIKSSKVKKYKEASDAFYKAYQVSLTDTTFLFNSAGLAIKANQIDRAIKLHKKLIKLKFTGQGIKYLATNKSTNKVESFNLNKQARDEKVNSGLYIQPLDVKEDSKQALIYKNLAFLYVNQNNFSDGESYLKSAYQLNPKDLDVVVHLFKLYMLTNRLYMFQRYESEAVKNFPKSVELFYNIGATYYNLGHSNLAKQNFEKAYKLDSTSYYLNKALGSLMLDKDQEFTNQLNKCKEGSATYQNLLVSKINLYKKCLSYFNIAFDKNPNDLGLKKIIRDLNIFIERYL